jgi:hypothetical protein
MAYSDGAFRAENDAASRCGCGTGCGGQCTQSGQPSYGAGTLGSAENTKAGAAVYAPAGGGSPGYGGPAGGSGPGEWVGAMGAGGFRVWDLSLGPYVAAGGGIGPIGRIRAWLQKDGTLGVTSWLPLEPPLLGSEPEGGGGGGGSGAGADVAGPFSYITLQDPGTTPCTLNATICICFMKDLSLSPVGGDLDRYFGGRANAEKFYNNSVRAVKDAFERWKKIECICSADERRDQTLCTINLSVSEQPPGKDGKCPSTCLPIVIYTGYFKIPRNPGTPAKKAPPGLGALGLAQGAFHQFTPQHVLILNAEPNAFPPAEHPAAGAVGAYPGFTGSTLGPGPGIPADVARYNRLVTQYIHEIGHALGADLVPEGQRKTEFGMDPHSSNPKDVMYPAPTVPKPSGQDQCNVIHAWMKLLKSRPKPIRFCEPDICCPMAGPGVKKGAGGSGGSGAGGSTSGGQSSGGTTPGGQGSGGGTTPPGKKDGPTVFTPSTGALAHHATT